MRGPIGGSFAAAPARKELRVRQGAHTWEGGRGGRLWQRLSVGSENRGGGSGLYRVRGKVGGRQTREIGHRLARPLAGLPSPRDLHTMERPQTPFTSDSSLLYYYNCQAGLFDFLSCWLVSHQLTQKYFEVGFRYFDGTSGELK